MKKLGVSIIGCGSIFINHVNAIINSDLVDLVSVVDIDEEKAKEIAKNYGCKYYANYKEMLQDDHVGVVHICTPHYLHGSMAIDAMKSGKHVLVEKPMGINEEVAKEMIEVSKVTKRHLGVSFQNRYNPTSIKAKEIIKQGTLGKVIGIKGIVTWCREKEYYTESSWRGKWSTEGGGALINQSIHTLDLMEWLVGDIEKIEGHASTRVLKGVIEVDDTAEATLYYKNGARGIFYATNNFTMNSPIEVEIHLENGTLRISDSQLVQKVNGSYEVIADDTNNDTGAKSYWGKGHEKMINKFHKSVIENDYNGYVTGSEGIKSLKIIDGIYKSK